MRTEWMTSSYNKIENMMEFNTVLSLQILWFSFTQIYNNAGDFFITLFLVHAESFNRLIILSVGNEGVSVM